MKSECSRTRVELFGQSDGTDFEEAWNRYLPATDKAATSATSETYQRRNVAAVASVAASAAAKDEEDSGLDV